MAIYRTKHGAIFNRMKERMDIKGNVANFVIVNSMESRGDIIKVIWLKYDFIKKWIEKYLLSV